MKKIAFLALYLYSVWAIAQVSLVGGAPYSFDNAAALLPAADLPLIQMPLVDAEALLAEDALVSDKQAPFRFGKEFDADISLTNDGWLDILPDGSRLYRIAIKCKKALSINLTYNQFLLPPDARFYLYTPDHSHQLGAFTDYNNKTHGQFSTSLLRGEITILEYYEPANASFPGIININKVVHGYRGLRSPEKDYGDSGNCNININCPEGAAWQNESRSVALIIEGGFRACTGAVVNNVRQDCRPYFLTADHCLSGSVNTWVFMFNYESPTCTNQDGPTNQTVSGCTLLANDGPSDFALVELSEPPPPEYNVYYAGWTAAESAATGSVGIHHPSGDIKKITFNQDLLLSDSWDGTPNTHWKVTEWEDGTTEPGSSGSPMFDPNHRIIGQLHGGQAACGNTEYDTYGKFAYSWDEGSNANTRLADWLDPDNTGILLLDGRSCSEAQFALDAAITLQNLPTTQCNQSVVQPQALLRNNGSEQLSSATINLTVDGLPQSPINWTGSLGYLQATLVALPDLTLAEGSHNIALSVSNPNGNTDQNAANDQASASVQIIVAPELEIVVTTDWYPDETSFEISNQQGQVVYSQTDGFYGVSDNEFSVCLPPGCYTLTLNDSYGDGIPNGGGFSVSLNGVELVSNFDFPDGFSISENFCFGNPTNPANADFSTNATAICANQSIQFAAAYTSPTATYSWQFEGGIPATATGQNPSVSYATPGTYDVSLSVTDGAAPIMQTLTDYIQVGISLAVSTTDAANPISNDGTAILTASFGANPYQYIWSNGADGAAQTNLPMGNYVVTATDANGCTDILPFAIGSLIAPMHINSIAANTQIVCVGDTVIFAANVAATPTAYEWTFSNGNQNYQSNAVSPSMVFVEEGLYTVTCYVNDEYTSATHTQSDYIQVIVPPQGTLLATQPSINPQGQPNGALSVSATGYEPLSYAWSIGSNTPTIDQLSEGTYSVTITDAAGCQTILTQKLEWSVSDPSGVVFYPAPSVGMPLVYNGRAADDKVMIELFDAAGRLLGYFELDSGNNELPLQLASGIYIARVWANDVLIKTEKLRIL